jgi:hypothetical protein
MVALAGCATLGFGSSGGPPKIEAACVLVADGGICTFRNEGGRGERCVRVLVGATSSGTVVASGKVCSGKLAKGGQMTVVVAFSTRPAEMCGRDGASCVVKVADPDKASEEAIDWSGDLKKSSTGPVTDADCRELRAHKYRIWADEDCKSITDPRDKQVCYDEVRAEERDDDSFLEDCREYYTREHVNCQFAAVSSQGLRVCEEKFDE